MDTNNIDVVRAIVKAARPSDAKRAPPRKPRKPPPALGRRSTSSHRRGRGRFFFDLLTPHDVAEFKAHRRHVHQVLRQVASTWMVSQWDGKSVGW